MTGPEPTSIDQPQPAPRNLADRIARRRDAAIAGHEGDAVAARALLDDVDPGVRATALAALARASSVTDDDLVAAATDVDPSVRGRAAEVLATQPWPTDAVSSTLLDALVRLLGDDDIAVVETAAWAVGEFVGRAAEAGWVVPDVVLERVSAIAADHEDALCREAAVAALGALGDERGLATILRATTDKATVRRRAIIALAPFEGPEVDAALEHAREDRDWQVRQAAEDLLADD
jgi:HEAT repeat protein